MNARTEEWEMKPGRVEYRGETDTSIIMLNFDKIAEALAKAQAEMSNPGFDSTNPHFRNKFASLAAVRNAVVPIMAKHGIFVSQDISSVDGGVSCVTILTHASGQQMRFGPLVLPVAKNDAQGFGSAATYCRRYALMAVACVVGDDDDDANAATGKASPAQAYEAPHSPKGDMGKNIPVDEARTAALSMMAILDEDVEENIKAMHVADRHDSLNANPELYVAAADQLVAKARSAWKAYVGMAKKLAQAEPRANGRS